MRPGDEHPSEITELAKTIRDDIVRRNIKGDCATTPANVEKFITIAHLIEDEGGDARDYYKCIIDLAMRAIDQDIGARETSAILLELTLASRASIS